MIEVAQVKNARYDDVAERYEKYVTLRFSQLAQDLIELAALQSGEKVLDVGTGTGVAALLAAPKVAPTGSVVGIDLSQAMLDIAFQKAKAEDFSIDFQCVDVEMLDLVFSEEKFDVVLSNFGLGTTDPDNSLLAIRQVLKRPNRASGGAGGRLVLAQWGPFSRPAKTFLDLLEKNKTSEPSSELQWLRDTAQVAHYWHNQSAAAMAAMLTAYGFRNVHVDMRKYSFTYTNSDAYVDMTRSYPRANAEFEAMSPGQRRMFRHEFNAATAPFRAENQAIVSEDEIIFAVATR